MNTPTKDYLDLMQLDPRVKAVLAAQLLAGMSQATFGDFFDALSPADRERLLELAHREATDASRFEPAPF